MHCRPYRQRLRVVSSKRAVEPRATVKSVLVMRGLLAASDNNDSYPTHGLLSA